MSSPSTTKKFIKWYLTRRCDLGCVFCHNADQRASWNSDADVARMSEIALRLRDSDQIAGLTLLGGEPTIASGFFEVTRNLIGAKFKFGIVTAGHHLAEPKFEELLENPNLKFLGISLDSLSREEVMELRKVDVLPQQIAAIKKAAAYRAKHNATFDIYINTVLTTKNGLNMPSVVENLRELGVNQVKILTFNVRGRGTESGCDLRPSMMQELDFVEILARQFDSQRAAWKQAKFSVEYCFLSSMGKSYVRNVLGVEDFPLAGHLCPISRSVAYIVNDGSIFPCEEFRPYFGVNPLERQFQPLNVLDHDIDTCLRSPYITDAFETVASPELYANYYPCNECPHLLNECVPCGILGTDKTQIRRHDRCSFYRELLVATGKYTKREAPLEPLRVPLIKHKGPSV